jgi:hypothetical protein
MTPVKLLTTLLIGTVHHVKDSVVIVPDSRARDFIAEGVAVAHDPDEVAEVANPDHDQLADFVSPAPPEGSDAEKDAVAKLEARGGKYRPKHGRASAAPAESATLATGAGEGE